MCDPRRRAYFYPRDISNGAFGGGLDWRVDLTLCRTGSGCFRVTASKGRAWDHVGRGWQVPAGEAEWEARLGPGSGGPWLPGKGATLGC